MHTEIYVVKVSKDGTYWYQNDKLKRITKRVVSGGRRVVGKS